MFYVLGMLKIYVDVIDVVYCVFCVYEMIFVVVGLFILLYLQWILGNYLFIGLIDKFVGFIVKVNGKMFIWMCDLFNVYVFYVDVFVGVSVVDVDFQFFIVQECNQGCIMMMFEMFSLQWDKVLVYLVGYNICMINVDVSVMLLVGWEGVIVLEFVFKNGDIWNYKIIIYNVLVDLLMFVGKYYKQVDFDFGVKVLVYMDLFVDVLKYFEFMFEQIKLYCELIQQMYKFYGVYYYGYYIFFILFSDKFGGIGLEYYQFSEDGVLVDYFIEWKKNVFVCDLFFYEYNYFWDGKYCCGVDFIMLNFNVLMSDMLLWVYEGQIQFWGYIVVVCVGLWIFEQICDMFVFVVVIYDKGCLGLVSWCNVQDIINDFIIVQCLLLLYCNY